VNRCVTNSSSSTATFGLIVSAMKYLVAGLVLGAATIASADVLPENSYSWRKPNTSGVFFDVGGGWERIHPPNGFTYRSDYLRIAP